MPVFGGLINSELPASGRNRHEVSSSVMSAMRWSMIATLFACALVGFRNYWCDNISCITGTEDAQEHIAIESYCFVTGTFTIMNLDADEAPHPGVGPPPLSGVCEDGAEDCESEDNMLRHAYYQWVPMVLLLQSAIYYLPKFLWKLRDKGYFKETMCSLFYISGDKHLLKHNIKSAAEYFNDNIKTNYIYAVSFLFCEIIAFSISVGNLYFTNTFLGGHFFKYGRHAFYYLTQPSSTPNNPLNQVFPKVSKCTWYKYGASGTMNTHDAMCVLPNNIYNEKTYLCLWVVYIATATATGIVLLWHIILFLLPSVRNTLLVWKTRNAHSDPNVNLQLKMNLQQLLPLCNYGDWFFIYHYSKQMAYFKDWLQQVRDLNNE